MLNKSIKFLIENKVIALVLLLGFLFWGLIHTPFLKSIPFFPSKPVAVDAIPNIGENQQIVFTEWKGQSPQDIEDQITYPLTSNLLGIPGVKTIRSNSMFGFSSIYIIFEDDIDFYWSRTRILEKINSLPDKVLPIGVKPNLGPDATALGQIFWYTLEGRDGNGNVVGGWDLHELRKVQDFYIKNALSSVKDVSEVASVGGFVQEYQIDLNPELMRQFGVSISDVVKAVKENNKDVGARTMEINNAEYFVRGLGYIKNIADIENTTVINNDFTPIRIKDVAQVGLGPEERRGILDKEGAEVVGGVVASRYGANPMEVINSIKRKIGEIAIGLPSKTLRDGRVSKLTIVPFYDRSELIQDTLGTLKNALSFEILITILVVLIMLFNLRVSVLISGLLPLAVLMVFIAMKLFNVEANIVALSGIAIAIGTMVDLGIILSENIIRHLNDNHNGEKVDSIVYEATIEVSGAIITAGFTTLISFVPVFSLTGAEGKLFTPLAFTKTAALFAAMFIALFLIPPILAQWYRARSFKFSYLKVFSVLLVFSGIVIMVFGFWLGFIVVGIGVIRLLVLYNKIGQEKGKDYNLYWIITSILIVLTYYWRPLGFGNSYLASLVFIGVSSCIILGMLIWFKTYYEPILKWALANKMLFLGLPIVLLLLGFLVFRNIGKEFMPNLDEGSYLLMPTSMPHAGIAENKKVLQQLDMAVVTIPEIETVVGKAGRVNSALDPAPLSMYENVILYKPEYILDENNRPIRFKAFDGRFETKSGKKVESGSGAKVGELIKDKNGEFYRNWRPEIKNQNDIWQEIIKATKLPGVTTAPKLQPIETRLVMLQTGMRAPMGIKIFGPDLKTIERFGIQVEKELKNIEGIEPSSVFADRIISKPYLILDIDRIKASRYGLSVEVIQEVLEVALAGKVLTETIEGRERFGVSVRYPRELRADPPNLANIYVPLDTGSSIPLTDVVDVKYETGPQVIKSEDSFLTGYVLFDKKEGFAEVNVIENTSEMLKNLIANEQLIVPNGVSYRFSGNYENQLHAEKTLSFIIPLVLLAIFFVLYLQFRSAAVTLMVFSGVAVAFAGGFILIWCYGQDWFFNINIGDINIRELFNMQNINLSVAVWVGFIALFGIATDDGVVMATYLKQSFERNSPTSIQAIRASVLEAGKKRLRPCLMTTATTLLALLPILTATGRGKDIMIPMAIPSFGGMLVALVSLFIVPVLYSLKQELKLK
ncbi:efflux RND transporter permease subunit [Maribacter sp. CXY002]|uniref:efflux RND transporter permease subunit n=1 Tax=Maribacter luteocoastalis TaxID=3407671 RepID=UPI003B67CC6B